MEYFHKTKYHVSIIGTCIIEIKYFFDKKLLELLIVYTYIYILKSWHSYLLAYFILILLIFQ